MKITKVKLQQKEVVRSRTHSFANPFEAKEKRSVTRNEYPVMLQVANQQEVQLLDPSGTITITTRLPRNEQPKESGEKKKASDSPSNLTKINKIINEENYKRQKRLQQAQEDEKFKVNSNSRLISYVK